MAPSSSWFLGQGGKKGGSKGGGKGGGKGKGGEGKGPGAGHYEQGKGSGGKGKTGKGKGKSSQTPWRPEEYKKCCGKNSCGYQWNLQFWKHCGNPTGCRRIFDDTPLRTAKPRQADGAWKDVGMGKGSSGDGSQAMPGAPTAGHPGGHSAGEQPHPAPGAASAAGNGGPRNPYSHFTREELVEAQWGMGFSCAHAKLVGALLEAMPAEVAEGQPEQQVKMPSTEGVSDSWVNACAAMDLEELGMVVKDRAGDCPRAIYARAYLIAKRQMEEFESRAKAMEGVVAEESVDAQCKRLRTELTKAIQATHNAKAKKESLATAVIKTEGILAAQREELDKETVKVNSSMAEEASISQQLHEATVKKGALHNEEEARRKAREEEERDKPVESPVFKTEERRGGKTAPGGSASGGPTIGGNAAGNNVPPPPTVRDDRQEWEKAKHAAAKRRKQMESAGESKESEDKKELEERGDTALERVERLKAEFEKAQQDLHIIKEKLQPAPPSPSVDGDGSKVDGGGDGDGRSEV